MKALKNILWVCAIAFLPSFIFAALPWQVLTALFKQCEIQLPDAEPFTAFCFRILGITFGMIGVFFVILARNPLKYGEMLLLSAYGLLLMGVLALIGSPHYELPIIALITIVKAIFYLILGAFILLFRKEAMQATSA